MKFRKFRGPFYDEVIYRDDLYYIMIKRRNKNQSQKPEVDVADIFKLLGSKGFTRKNNNRYIK